MKLTERLKELRRARQWTMAQIAAASGLSLSYINDLENGRGNPTLDALVKLAGGYDLTLVEMLYPVEFPGEGGLRTIPFDFEPIGDMRDDC